MTSIVSSKFSTWFKALPIFIGLICLGNVTIAQSVAPTTLPDTVIEKKGLSRPAKAALLSLAMPGAGQVYNDRLWKLPILYGGGMVIGFLIVDNNRKFKVYRDAVINRLDENPKTTDPFPLFTENQLRIRREFYRRNRDFNIILAFSLYGLNVLDALVDAHLHNFSVTDDLELNIEPEVSYCPNTGISSGIHLTFTIK